ncbi:2OG-Fe(II) oxygenase [Flavobacterium cerinum]|uniref:Prolyl 4-hydroxylase subunit alpha n=1 Tax=Flavobacterium cerinum TaxID=2502784 RepID=A0A3S3R0N8_9FLAO|nr:2OG-Fe(II) oxygenase [Flavobacterium cerinum]RWX00850.1 prolyl 4-hydroxylase subunit alpha [Flavobacterium cerinum]
MNTIEKKIATFSWDQIAEDLNTKGYTVIPRFLSGQECEVITSLYDTPSLYRKTVIMERHRFGLGEYKYFNYPLPDTIASIRKSIYPYLSAVANLWMKALNINTVFPSQLETLHEQCRNNNQTKPTVLVLKYGKGGFNTLHQDIYGDVFFPMQAVIMLNEPGEDYTGGEFVLTEQIPRAQSKAIVLKPVKGDMLIFTTNFRPVKGTKGYYRVNMKHGVSEVHNGKRMALGIIFHDATT